MEFEIIAAVLIGVAAVFFLLCYICFRMAFYMPEKRKKSGATLNLPNTEPYLLLKERIARWQKELLTLPHEEVSIRSFDGLTLYGNYYEFTKGAPVELLFHGYRSTAARDLCGGLERCAKLGRNVILVNHRASGNSEGNVITFGINESKDCLAWTNYVIERFGKDVKIFIGGISMGGATVAMASAMDLPQNVLCGVVDCSFTSPKEIICKTIAEMKLPPKLCYPLVKLGAKIFGHFDLEENSPLQAVQNSRIPLVFIHGADDDFVPTEMGERLYEACVSKKKLYITPNAAHGLAYPVDPEQYVRVLHDAETEWEI